MNQIKIKSNEIKKIVMSMNLQSLDELFNDDQKCVEFMSRLKWTNGFVCRKCQHDNFCKGKIPFSRRCTRCKNEESALANTIFHHSKFPVSKAFYMAYEICEKGESVSSHELALKLDLRQMTCWNFKDKLLKKIALCERTNSNVEFHDILLTK